jgi:hypothetical protein
VEGAAREICSPLIEAATRRSDEVPATRPAKLKGHPQKAVSIHCKLRAYLFFDRCEPSRRSHRR